MNGVDRETAHVLLDEIFDGGHEGNISAMMSSMYVYAEAVEDRKRFKELEKRVENLKIASFHRRLDHGRFPENKGG